MASFWHKEFTSFLPTIDTFTGSPPNICADILTAAPTLVGIVAASEVIVFTDSFMELPNFSLILAPTSLIPEPICLTLSIADFVSIAPAIAPPTLPTAPPIAVPIPGAISVPIPAPTDPHLAPFFKAPVKPDSSDITADVIPAANLSPKVEDSSVNFLTPSTASLTPPAIPATIPAAPVKAVPVVKPPSITLSASVPVVAKLVVAVDAEVVATSVVSNKGTDLDAMPKVSAPSAATVAPLPKLNKPLAFPANPLTPLAIPWKIPLPLPRLYILDNRLNKLPKGDNSVFNTLATLPITAILKTVTSTPG